MTSCLSPENLSFGMPGMLRPAASGGAESISYGHTSSAQTMALRTSFSTSSLFQFLINLGKLLILTPPKWEPEIQVWLTFLCSLTHSKIKLSENFNTLKTPLSFQGPSFQEAFLALPILMPL